MDNTMIHSFEKIWLADDDKDDCELFDNHQKEESFIFRLKTATGRILIAWENSKEGRATHLFITDNTNCDQRLQLIESYIIDPTPSKRALLHFKDKDAKSIKRELLFIETINHDSISAYKTNLQVILSRY